MSTTPPPLVSSSQSAPQLSLCTANVQTFDVDHRIVFQKRLKNQPAIATRAARRTSRQASHVRGSWAGKGVAADLNFRWGRS